MKVSKAYSLLCLLIVIISSCDKPLTRSTNANLTEPATQNASNDHPSRMARRQHSERAVHILVALCDNINQGIVPVPARLGNGEDLQNNLYWGAAYGVKAFFNRKGSDWQLLSSFPQINSFILERCVFKHKVKDVYLIVDAYKGAEIKRCIANFVEFAAGGKPETVPASGYEIDSGGSADLLVYIGHDGLMDFNLDTYPKRQDDKQRDVIMLCCFSKRYFAAPLQNLNANPLLWTTGLMAPEAYILKAALDGWILNEKGEQIRNRAAAAYNQYQHCGLKAAGNLFATGR